MGSRKARRLLALLAVHCGYVPIDRIAVVLWETSTPRHPAANVATPRQPCAAPGTSSPKPHSG